MARGYGPPYRPRNKSWAEIYDAYRKPTAADAYGKSIKPKVEKVEHWRPDKDHSHDYDKQIHHADIAYEHYQRSADQAEISREAEKKLKEEYDKFSEKLNEQARLAEPQKEERRRWERGY